jgi:hypothetical protein
MYRVNAEPKPRISWNFFFRIERDDVRGRTTGDPPPPKTREDTYSRTLFLVGHPNPDFTGTG